MYTSITNPHTRSFSTLTMILISIIFLVPIGCADLQGALSQANTWRENAKIIESDLNTQLSSLNEHRDQLTQNQQSTHEIDSTIAHMRAQIDTLQSAIAKANLVIKEAQNPNDPLTQSTQAISHWIPAPAQGPFVLGAALIATMFRSHKLKQSATSIVQSIEHTLNRDPEFKRVFIQNADSIRTIQTPSARKLIDHTQRKNHRPNSFNHAQPVHE